MEVFELKDNILVLEREKESSTKQCLKLEEALSQTPQTSNTIIYKYEKYFQKFLKNRLERSIMTYMIYGVSQNKKRGIRYDFDEDEKIPYADDKPKSSFFYHYTHAQT